jgi:hypothetical protein
VTYLLSRHIIVAAAAAAVALKRPVHAAVEVRKIWQVRQGPGL